MDKFKKIAEKEIKEWEEIQYFWWWWFNGFRTRNDPIIINIEE